MAEIKVKYTDENRRSIVKANEAKGYMVIGTETFADGSKEFTFTDELPANVASPVAAENFHASYAAAGSSDDKIAVIARMLGLV
tara:strand:- start:1 stop:252 length:252 start_codon:yes stop_codon:yes gene_type:complete